MRFCLQFLELKAVDIQLTSEELARIDALRPKNTVASDRYAYHHYARKSLTERGEN